MTAKPTTPLRLGGRGDDNADSYTPSIHGALFRLRVGAAVCLTMALCLLMLATMLVAIYGTIGFGPIWAVPTVSAAL